MNFSKHQRRGLPSFLIQLLGNRQPASVVTPADIGVSCPAAVGLEVPHYRGGSGTFVGIPSSAWEPSLDPFEAPAFRHQNCYKQIVKVFEKVDTILVDRIVLFYSIDELKR